MSNLNVKRVVLHSEGTRQMVGWCVVGVERVLIHNTLSHSNLAADQLEGSRAERERERETSSPGRLLARAHFHLVNRMDVTLSHSLSLPLSMH